MKALAIVGTSALGGVAFVERLVEALRLEGLSVSCVKRAPDGFDLDRPGKASFARREAGAAEVLLAGDERFVLMKEYRGPAPALEALLARLEPVDLVIVEGFHETALPTLEIHRPSDGPTPRPRGAKTIALVCDGPLETGLPAFGTDEIGRIAALVIARLGLQRA